MEEERKVVILKLDDILPNRFQPRIKFSENAINELAESIKLHGVIQPIVVRKISDKYEIIAGERRYKASIIAGKTTIPAIVTTLDDKNSAEVALIENVQRQDLTPIEEAISYKKILDMGYINQQELGAKLGKKQSTIANKLRLLNLNDEVQEALMDNKISERHARSLLRLDDKKQILMLNRIISERLTVRKTDQEIEKLLNDSNGEQKEIKEEKGEMKMNSDILKDFNIPTEPIVNDSDNITFEESSPVPTASNTDVPVTPVVNQPIETPQVNQPEPINPGFMDVDKIQSVAQDIVSEPAPVADMDELLKVDENTKNEAPQVEQPLIQMEQAPRGKFFNMFDYDEPEKSDNIEDKQVNMDFGGPTPTTPTFNPISNSIPTNDSSLDIFGQNEVDSVPTTPSSVEQPIEPLVSEPIANVVQTPIETPVSTPVEPVETPQINIIGQTNDTTEPFTNSVEPLTLTDDNEFTSSNVVQNPTPQTQIPANNFVNNTVNRPYMMDDEVKFDDEGEIEVQIPKQNENVVTVDMKTVINTIRECAATIEKYGYRIETDELDLADSYEVTFKIQKND